MNITISGRKVDQVKQFTYLGSVISNDAYSTREIKTRIPLAKNAFSKHSRTLTAKKLKQSLRTEERGFSSVWSGVLLYMHQRRGR